MPAAPSLGWGTRASCPVPHGVRRGALVLVLVLVPVLVLVLFLVPGAAAAEPLPSSGSATWARGPYGSMHMLLEKTLLKINVLTLHVHVTRPVQRRFSALIGKNGYSEKLGERLARVMLAADDALIEQRFLRDVSLSQWLDAVFENLEQAREAGLISRELLQRVRQRLPVTFGALAKRGYERGDRILYRVGAGSVRTVVVSDKGKVYVDRTDEGKEPPHVVLATYFAPKGDFREPLLRSLFE